MKIILFHVLALFLRLRLCASECNGIPPEDLATTTVLLSAKPRTIIEYRSTETKLHVTMTSEMEGWLGIGYAKGGKFVMVGNDAVIGTKSSSSQPTGLVRKFALQSQQADGVVELGSALQTLENSTFVSPIDLPGGAVGSKMIFSKLLSDGTEVIPSSGEAKFIWALAEDYNLLWHSAFGVTALTLDPCKISTGEEEDPLEDASAVRYRQAIKAHGIIAVVAFGLFMPVAIAASALHKYLDFDIGGKKAWMQLHIGLNTASFVLATVVLAMAIVAKNEIMADHLQRSHEKVGVTVYALMVLQVFAGFVRPSPPSKSPAKELTQTGVEEVTAHDVDVSGHPRTDLIVQKSMKRSAWEIGHKGLGLAMIALILYTLFSGIDLYDNRNGKEQYRMTMYWVWFGFALLLSVFVLCRTVVSTITK